VTLVYGDELWPPLATQALLPSLSPAQRQHARLVGTDLRLILPPGTWYTAPRRTSEGQPVVKDGRFVQTIPTGWTLLGRSDHPVLLSGRTEQRYVGRPFGNMTVALDTTLFPVWEDPAFEALLQLQRTWETTGDRVRRILGQSPQKREYQLVPTTFQLGYQDRSGRERIAFRKVSLSGPSTEKADRSQTYLRVQEPSQGNAYVFYTAGKVLKR
jgi:hypothetical protein